MPKDRLDRILEKVIRMVTPSDDEKAKVRDMTEKVMSATKRVADSVGEEIGMKLGVVLAGSFVRDTWMPHKKEFDVFIQFPENTNRTDLETYGLEIGKKVVKSLKGTHMIAYAEHPYMRAKIQGYAIDLVPCYRVSSASKIKSAVDRTPFHNKWLEKHMAPSKAPQVRLMKQFTKAQGLYGSDTRVQGFSGYLCELLITKHKTFKFLARAASRWKPGVFIDIQGHYKPSPNSRERLRGQPLVVIDPVDPERNAAAALSEENFGKFVSSCRQLLRNPSLSFFKPEKHVSMSKLSSAVQKRKAKIFGVMFSQPQIIQDVLWPQMRKAAKRLADILEEYDFRVSGWSVWADEEFTKGHCLLLLELKSWELPQLRTLRGPPVKEKKHADNFLKKYRPMGKTYAKGRYWFAEFRREFRKADEKLKDTLSDPEKRLREKGIPSYIAKAVSRDFRMLNEKQILSLAKRKPGLAQSLRDWLKA